MRTGERASLTVFANSLQRTETNEATGEESESAIHYIKGYSVFNTEQIDGLPAQYDLQLQPVAETVPRTERAENDFAALARRSAMAARKPITLSVPIISRCHPSKRSRSRGAVSVRGTIYLTSSALAWSFASTHNLEGI